MYNQALRIFSRNACFTNDGFTQELIDLVRMPTILSVQSMKSFAFIPFEYHDKRWLIILSLTDSTKMKSVYLFLIFRLQQVKGFN
jgi:hypothetical protein